MGTKVIFFDLDHTLIDTRRQYLLGLQMTLQSLYANEAPGDFVQHFMQHNDELWPEYDKRRLTMTDLRRQRFLRTWRDYGITRTEAEADVFQEHYSQTFATTLTCFPGTIEMLEVLSKDYQLGIITNGAPDLQGKKLFVTGLQPFFPEHAVVVSEVVGRAKPHPLVYQTACARFGAEPEQCWMIGDNYTNDVAGARACGLSALWYGPDEVTTKEHEPVTGQVLQEKPLRSAQQVLEQLSVAIKSNWSAEDIRYSPQ